MTARRQMTPEQKAAQDDTIRQLVASGLSYYEVGKKLGISDDTVGRIVRNESKAQVIKERCLKRLQADIDVETWEQIMALSEHWELPRSEVLRILLDWGLESLDGPEKKICQEAAANCSVGAL